MAETVGLVVGVVALSGLFNNAVECFEFVQLGRDFEKSFQTSQLKLDNARLRLSRWGKSLGLDMNAKEGPLLLQQFGTEATIKHAEAVLEQVIELFADAEGVSNKFKSKTEPHDVSLVVYDTKMDLDPSTAKLHEEMRRLSLERQNRTGIRQRAKWALYREKQFRRLIEDVTDLVDKLVEIFPAAQQIQRDLCDEEVSVIKAGTDSEGVSLLKTIAEAQDKLLEQAMEKAEDKDNGSHHITFSGDNNSGFQLGHNSGAISGFTFGKGN